MARLYRPPLRPPISLLYRGNKVECPLCNQRFRSFVPAVRPSGPNRLNELCPNCGARDRHRHLWLYLKNETNLLLENSRVLHFAPERIFERLLKAQRNLDYVSADLQRRRAAVLADITEIPFSDDSFDVILCSHVLEHVQDDRKAMRELRRVLKPEGWAVILVPISSKRAQTYEDPAIVSPKERERAFGQHDHVRIYGRDFKDRLLEAGFKVADPKLEEGEERARKFGLRRRNPHIHLCFKGELSNEQVVTASEASPASLAP
jgi:predicted SAM-dependent methyltransferase